MRQGYETFTGVQRDAHRSRLGEGRFQEDVNGDRSDEGTWKRRRGYQRMAVERQDASVTTIFGFELRGADFGLVVVSGTDAEGVVNAALLELPTTGYGVVPTGTPAGS